MREEEKLGHLHPITIIIREITALFTELGFEVASGPEIEEEYYNFDALNVPKDHPARDMQDTFWLPSSADSFRPDETDLKQKNYQKRLLRTHTSPVQVRYMETHEPPFQIIVPGKVYRYEATDATHETQFHQIEGLVVGKNLSLANLKYVLQALLKKLYGEEINIKLRPGYFPFVEPGVEIDMQCFRCKGAGCTSCKESGWIEILGGGMVHPAVLENVGIDPRKWRGFAFGVGVERLIMLKYGVEDIRMFYTGDLRLVNQF
ncbi:MAG TPA: phenylalanine--tRNA ligase subunit alpha [Candidatus Paceibacterota bacterium]|nr:phenylalanine--tRNA ligase subunit alpha [Candidatus Paceibacterota bacterium]